MPAGLSRSEYEQLQCPTSQEAYPKSTLGVVQELQERGYAVDVTVLNYLVKTGKVQPDRIGQRNFSWQKEQIDLVVGHLEEQQSYCPAVVAASHFGYRYASYLESLRKAVLALREQTRDATIAMDPNLFVMEVHPSRFGKPARVSFRVCEDVKAHLMNHEANESFHPGVLAAVKRRSDEGSGPPVSTGTSPVSLHRSGMAFSAQ